MNNFLHENKGLIVKICRKYRFDPKDIRHVIEEAYCEAYKTYHDGHGSKKYNFVNHFIQYLKSFLAKEKTIRDRTEYIEDGQGTANIDSEENTDSEENADSKENADNGYRSNGRRNGRKKVYIKPVYYECSRATEIVAELISSIGQKKTKEILCFIKHQEYDKAIVVSEKHAEIVNNLIAELKVESPNGSVKSPNGLEWGPNGSVKSLINL